MADWQQVRSEYEQGASLRQLAEKYAGPGISKSSIGRRAFFEQWKVPSKHGTWDSGTPTPPPVPLPQNAIDISNLLMSHISTALQQPALETRDIKSLADALSACTKVLITAPQPEQGEQEDGLFIPLGRISPETRMEIRRLLALDAQEREQVG